MTLIRQIGAEAVKALAVLALVFLAFAHDPVRSPVYDGDGVYAVSSYSAVSYCGQGPSDHGASHEPCHACRAGIADLPPPPCAAEPAYPGFVGIAHGPGAADPIYEAVHRSANPRAPPALV